MNEKTTLETLLKLGLTEEPNPRFFITDEPKIPGYTCHPMRDVETILSTRNVVGYGFDIKPRRAQIKAIAECLERLCLENPDKNKLRLSSYNESDLFVDPSLFWCYSAEQISRREQYFALLKSTELLWYPALNLYSGEEIFVPGQTIFLSTEFDEEIPIRNERISTGAAFGHRKTQHALKAGLLEVVERDSCMAAYLSKKNVPRIVDVPDESKEIVEYLQRYRLEPFIFDVTTDLHIPSVVVVLVDRTGIGPAIDVGARSAFTYRDAIKYALLEAVQFRQSTRISNSFSSRKTISQARQIRTMDDRAAYWYPLERVKDLSFWVETEREISYNDIKEKDTSFERIIDIFREKGYHIFVADITLPQIRGAEFETLKVIIPELHPLYIDEHAKALYSKHHGTIKKKGLLKPHPFT